ncbi:MAG: V-type ATPase subunit [Candidatus Heimdallarchaeota archaeon]|nr:V-type ATPase subunit [Candidatus Heimdallarchaeota archaeon]
MTSNIKYLVAKAHANHALSPSFDNISAMLNAERVIDVENILLNTSYSAILDEIRPSVDLTEFEFALRRYYARMLHLYKNSSSGEVAKLLNAYMLVIEAENMDIIFQAIIKNNVTPDLEKVIIPVGKYGFRRYQRIMQNTKAEIASDFIAYPELRRAVTKALDQSSDPDEQIFHVSSALSHITYSILNEVSPTWIRLEIEFENLTTICRSIKMGLDPNIWLIPNKGKVNKYKSSLKNMSTPREVISFMLPMFPVTRPLEVALAADDKDIINVLESQLSTYLFYKRKRDFVIFGNRKEAILDYFTLKRAEIEDISRIILSKTKKIDNDELRKMIYPIYKR